MVGCFSSLPALIVVEGGKRVSPCLLLFSSLSFVCPRDPSL